MEVEGKLYLSRIFDNIISRPTFNHIFNIYEILALVLYFIG